MSGSVGGCGKKSGKTSESASSFDNKVLQSASATGSKHADGGATRTATKPMSTALWCVFP